MLNIIKTFYSRERLLKVFIPLILIVGLFSLRIYKSKSPTEPENVYAAQFDYFLKIPGIEGESTRQGHGGEIDVESWSWGETREAALLVPAVQKVREAASRNETGAIAQEIMFNMPMSKASPILMQYAASGKHIDEEVILTGQRATDPEPYLIIKMKPVLVNSYQTGGSAGEVVSMDSISLNFEKVELKYRPQDSDGSLGNSVKGSWDFEKNTEVEEEEES